MPAPLGYSRTHIILHWLVAGLLVLQFLLNETITESFDAALEGHAVPMSLLGAQHVLTGMTIAILVIWRLVLRRKNGVPSLPANEPAMMKLVAHLTHWGLYALLLLTALSGSVAWFGLVEQAGDMHGLLTTLILILTGLHVVGALYHQFVLKTNLMDRMRTPNL